MSPAPPPDRPPRRRSGWRTFGIVLATALAVAGLALAAFVVWFMVALSEWGSNK